MAPTMLEELCKRIQHCCATLRRSRNKRNVGSCLLKSLTGFKLCATTSNNMQQGVQTDATCNIQQCWELLHQQCCVPLHGALVISELTQQDWRGKKTTNLVAIILFEQVYAKLHVPLKRCFCKDQKICEDDDTTRN